MPKDPPTLVLRCLRGAHGVDHGNRLLIFCKDLRPRKGPVHNLIDGEYRTLVILGERLRHRGLPRLRRPEDEHIHPILRIDPEGVEVLIELVVGGQVLHSPLSFPRGLSIGTRLPSLGCRCFSGVSGLFALRSSGGSCLRSGGLGLLLLPLRLDLLVLLHHELPGRVPRVPDGELRQSVGVVSSELPELRLLLQVPRVQVHRVHLDGIVCWVHEEELLERLLIVG